MSTYNDIIKGTEKIASLVDVEEVLKNLARLLQKTVKSSWVVIYQLDRDRHRFNRSFSYKVPTQYHALFSEIPLSPDSSPLIRNMLRKRRHLLLNDAPLASLLPSSFNAVTQRLNLLLVPMVVRNQMTGVLFIARGKSLSPFSSEELTLVHDMISHAALVASNMMLFDESLDLAVEMAKGIDIILSLDEINKAISSSLSRDRIIETAMQNIERITRCELGALLQVERGGLVVIASHAYGPVMPPQLSVGSRPVAGPCAAWTSFTSATSCYIPNLPEARHAGALDRELAKTGLKSLLAVPLIIREKVTGVLLLGDTRSGQFGQEAAFSIEKIAAQMAVALENARLYEDMRSLFINTISSLANVIDAKSPWTKGHSERVMHLASAIAREMGLEEEVVEQARLGGLLHDIGKIGIMEALLEKPAILSEDEFPPLRLHPEKGVTILAPIEQLEGVLPAILHHHERYDGGGYPKGLKGEDIPLVARIVTVADSFDAMVEDRPYRKGFAKKEAVEELRRHAGTQFDPVVVEHLITYLTRTGLIID